MIKRGILTILILGFAFTQQSAINAGGRCSGDSEYKKGLAKLSGFRLLKDFRISLPKAKKNEPVTISYPVSLTAGLKYKFIPVNNPSNEGDMIMNLYLNKRKEMLIATTYNKATDKHYPSIEFECKTTSTLYLFFSFESGVKGCGVGIVAVE